MPRNVFLYTTMFCDDFNAVFTVGVTRDGQQFTILCYPLVFLDDVFGYFQQADITLRTRLLAVGFNPQMTIEGDLQVLFCQVRHIRPVQARKRAEDEQIADEFIVFLFERAVDELFDFLFSRKAPFRFLFRDAIRVERISLEPTVVDGHKNDASERHHVRPYRMGAMVLLGTQE